MGADSRSSTGPARSSPPSSPGLATWSTRSCSAPSEKESAQTPPRDKLRWRGCGKLCRFRRPDVSAADLADARQALGGVHLELGLGKTRRDQSRAVFIDRDRA